MRHILVVCALFIAVIPAEAEKPPKDKKENGGKKKEESKLRAFVTIGKQLYSDGAFKQSIDYFTRALAESPTDKEKAAILNNIALAYDQLVAQAKSLEEVLDRKRSARLFYRQAADVYQLLTDPNEGQRSSLTECLSRQNQLAADINDLELRLRLSPPTTVAPPKTEAPPATAQPAAPPPPKPAPAPPPTPSKPPTTIAKPALPPAPPKTLPSQSFLSAHSFPLLLGGAALVIAGVGTALVASVKPEYDDVTASWRRRPSFELENRARELETRAISGYAILGIAAAVAAADLGWWIYRLRKPRERAVSLTPVFGQTSGLAISGSF